ncbi:hypothetical protein, partial [Acetobacter pasteurianus]|uniref:hypothetical protein n=1 Tax=Acetobacter pasteurianus TaxID=438 RepID=UPI0011CE6882
SGIIFWERLEHDREGPCFRENVRQHSEGRQRFPAATQVETISYRRGNLTVGLYIGLDYEKVYFV